MIIKQDLFGQKIFTDASERGRYENENWKQVGTKRETVELNGRNYKVLEKKEHYLPFFSPKRIGSIALGLLVTIPTFGLSLLSKTVRQFFTGREVVRILAEDDVSFLRDKPLKDVLIEKKAAADVENENEAVDDVDGDDDWFDPEPNIKPDDKAETYRFTPMQPSQIDERTLFQIVADEFGAASELEGGLAEDMVNNLHQYLTNANQREGAKYYYPENLIDELSRAINLKNPNDLSQFRDKIIDAYNAGQSTLIMGGWAGVPSGHAIYYEVIPAVNNEVNFRLYNTGAGIQYHIAARDGDAIKYQPYCEWKGIKLEKLLDENFLTAIREMKSCTHDGASLTEYGEDDVYIGLKKLLNPSSEVDAEEIKSGLMMSPQRSGVCSSRSLLAWMRSHLPPADYKRFKSDYKLQMLSDFINSQPNEPVEVKNWRLASKSFESICRGITKLYKSGLIGDDYIQSVLEPLGEIRNWVKSNKACHYTKPEVDLSDNFRDPVNFNIDIESSSSSLKSAINDQENQIFLSPSPISLEAFKRLQVNDAKTIIQTIESAVDVAVKAWNAGEDVALHEGLVDFVTKLSLGMEFWKKATEQNPKKAEALIAKLGELSSYFMRSCFTVPHAEILTPEKVYVMDKLTCLQYLVYSKGHPDSPWKDMLMSQTLDMDPYFTFTNPRMAQDVGQIEFYCGGFKNQNLISPTSYHIKGRKLERIFQSNDINLNDALADIVGEQYPNIIEQIKEKNSDWSRFSKEERKAHIYSSEFLPPWMKAMRDTILCSAYLRRIKIEPLANFRRESAFLPTYSVENHYQRFSLSEVPENFQKSEDQMYKENLLLFGNYRKNLSPFWQDCHKAVSKLRSYDDPEIEITFKSLLEPDSKHLFNNHDLREVMRPFLTQELGSIEAIEYFTNNPEKLKEKDYQILLYLLIFKKNLQNNLRVKGFEEHLSSFIEKNYRSFANYNSIQPAVFFLKMAQRLKSFCPETKFFGETVHELQKLLQRKELSSEIRNVILAEIAAQLGEKERLNPEEIETLITASIYLKENKLESNELFDPDTERRANLGVFKHASEIEKALSIGNPNQKLLNAILKNLRPNAQEKTWEIHQERGKFPSFRTDDEEYTLHPLRAQLHSREAYMLLPHNIRENPLFSSHFPNIERGNVNSNETYSFLDASHNTVYVRMNDDNLVIEKDIQNLGPDDNGVYRLIPDTHLLRTENNIFASAIGSRTIVEECVLWRSLEGKDKIFAIDRKTQTPRYLLNEKRDRPIKGISIDEVREISTHLKLGAASNLFVDFEDPEYIQEWYDDANHCVKIELPRFNLTFTRDATGRFVCREFPGFYVNQTKEIPSLGTYFHRIILENDEGQSKVLLPRQKTAPLPQKEVLAPAFAMRRNLEPGAKSPQEYYVYSLEGKSLLHKSRPAKLHLAEVMATMQNYKKAVNLLKEFGNKLSPFSESEKESLKNITKIQKVTGDNSGNGIAVRVLAGYLLIKNATINDLAIPEEEWENLQSEYSLYLDHFNHLTAFKLSKEQEIFLLKTLLDREFEPSYHLRLKELDPSAAKNIPVRNVKPPISNIDEFSDPIDEFTLRDSSLFPYNPNPILLTRLSNNVDRDFLSFYEQARIGTREERKRINDMLIFLKAEKKYLNHARILEAVLDRPQKFPKLAAYIPEYVREWSKKVKAAANEYLEATYKNIKFTPARSPVDITPKHFRFERKRNKAAPIAFSNRDNLEVISRPGFNTLFKQEASRVDPNQVNAYKDTISSINLSDPVAEKEKLRLLSDIDSLQPAAVYEFESGSARDNLNALSQNLNENRLEDKANIARLERDLLRLSNKLPEDRNEQNLITLQRHGKTHKVISLEELIVFYARSNPEALHERNPALTPQDIHELLGMVEEYLLVSTREQQRVRVEKKWQKTSELSDYDTPLARELINDLGAEYSAVRHYQPKDHPAYLAFEFFSNVLMRPQQVSKLDHFLRGGNDNLIMEMIMGSGKSKVLLPLLGLLRADGENISMLIVPQPLFESISQDTQGILQSFGQGVHALHFDRDTKFDKSSLERIWDTLKQIRDNRECLVMTSKSVQSLLLKFFEKGFEHLNSKNRLQEFSEELAIMGKIINLLRENGFPMIDEADTVLNVLHEVCFSSGSKSAPEQSEFEVISEIYKLVYLDPEIASLSYLESSVDSNSQNTPFTEELYFREMQMPLAEKLIDRFSTMTFNSKELTEKLHRFIKNISPLNKKLLKDYITRNADNLNASERYFNTLDPDIQNIAALASEEISHLLPFTLSKICDIKYGLDFDENTRKIKGPLAIPFAAAKVPSTGSQFSNIHVTMNYTFQTYMKNGVTVDLVEEQVKRIQNQAFKETKEENISIHETKAWKMLDAIRGDIDIPFNYHPNQIQQLADHINRNPSIKLQFVKEIVLPQMEVFQSKISCNPQNLIGMFQSVSGFTGTLWNSRSMAHSLSPEGEPGIDSKTLLILFNNSQGNVKVIKEGSSDAMLESLNDIDYDMLADSGGYFKDKSNAELARSLANLKNKNVVYYKGEQMITRAEGDAPLGDININPEDRLTFLDQSHTTGADVPQKIGALGLVTIGRNMLLRDLLQSVWRLRGLDKSQKVRFVVSEEVCGIIRQTLGLEPDDAIQFDQILSFVIINQAMQQGQDNYKALKQQLDLIPQTLFMRVLLNENIKPEAKLQAYIYLEKEWMKPANMSAKERYGALPSMLDHEKVVNGDSQAASDKIKELFKKMPWLAEAGLSEQACLDEIDRIVLHLKEFVPKDLPSPSGFMDSDQTVEVEVKAETETEVETELESQESAQVPDQREFGFFLSRNGFKSYGTFQKTLKAQIYFKRSLPFLKCPSFSLGSYLESKPEFAAYKGAFEGIDITSNILECIFSDDKAAAPNDFKLFGNRSPSIHHLYIKRGNITVMSANESRYYRKADEYYNLTLGFNDRSKKINDSTKLKILKIKFLNGESQFTKPELELLRTWFIDQGAAKMRKLFEKHIISTDNKKTKAASYYANSSLKKLFDKMGSLEEIRA